MLVDGWRFEIMVTEKMKSMEGFCLPRWEELPDVDLYLEQVLSLIDQRLLEYMAVDEKKLMTKTMVNNYVKQKIILPPINKKYDKLGVASLFVICILKSVYSINDIAGLIGLALKVNDMGESYNRFCEATEDAVTSIFVKNEFPKVWARTRAQQILQNAAGSFACKLYVQKTFLESRNFEKAENVIGKN